MQKKCIYIFVFILLSGSVCAQPAITYFAPTGGPVGTIVTISGSGFSANPSDNIVFFGAVRVPVISASSNMIKVKVPTGTTYQPISVTVNGLTAYSKFPFVPHVDHAVNNPQDLVFPNRTDFPAGDYPQSIATGDLDGDGKTDIISSNNLSGPAGYISILRNTSTPNHVLFAAPFSLPSGLGTLKECVRDIDGDGKLDIMVINSIDNTLSLYRNISTPGVLQFEPGIDLVTGAKPSGLDAADFDNDGRLDIMVVNQNASTVSVFRNNGSIGNFSFDNKIDFISGSGPMGGAAADIDGDGKPDISVANTAAHTISVLVNLCTPGVINFASRVDFSTGNLPVVNTVAGDWSQSGKNDIFLPDTTYATFGVLANTSNPGSTNFNQLFVISGFTVGPSPGYISFGDVSGDGMVDAVVTNINSDTLTVMGNASNGNNIAFWGSWGKMRTQMHPRVTVLADFDGDGRTDIAVCNSLSKSISVFLKSLTPGCPTDATAFTYTCLPAKTVSFNGQSDCIVADAWDFGDPASGQNNISAEMNSVHTFSVAGLYTVSFSFTLQNGQTYNIQKQINVSDINANIDQPVSCHGKQDAILHVTASGNAGPYTYVWNTTPVQTTQVITAGAGNYTVTVTPNAPNACVVNDTLTVAEPPGLPADLGPAKNICPGQSILLAPGNFSSYLWQDNSTAPVYTVTQAGQYSITVADAAGCTGSDTVQVGESCDLYFPSSFTPNDDGRNDLFGPAGNDFGGVTNYHFEVYNRYGKLIFLSTDPYKKWDGKVAGKIAGNESFVWFASFSIDGKKDFQKGTVTLIK